MARGQGATALSPRASSRGCPASPVAERDAAEAQAELVARLLDDEANRISCSNRQASARASYAIDAPESAAAVVLQIEAALNAVDRTHPFLGQPRIPLLVKSGSREQALGGETVGGYSHWRGVPISIDVAADAPSPALSVLHEIGHQLDQQMFAPLSAAEDWGSELDPLLDDWRQTVMDSRGYATLINACERGLETLDPELVLYTISLKEAFARSYAQWVAIRCDDADLQAELAETLVKESEPGVIQLQWQPDDFAPIAEALDEAFAVYAAFAGDAFAL
jgi:hypothetical protein